MKKSIGLCAFLLCGCTTKPEDQPPVDLQPGMYEVQVGGGTLVRLKSDERVGEVCIFGSGPLLPSQPSNIPATITIASSPITPKKIRKRISRLLSSDPPWQSTLLRNRVVPVRIMEAIFLHLREGF